MKTFFHYHNTDASLSNIDQDGYAWVMGKGGLVDELQAMPLSIWPDKSKSQKDKFVLQCVHNGYLKHVLDAKGWDLEPLISRDVESSRRADFSAGSGARKVLVEVEFGNSSRLDSALIKFQTAYYQNALKVAVLVVATHKMARDTDSGLATFEAMVRSLRTLDPRSVPFPLIVIGVEPDTLTTTLDWSTATKFASAQQLSGRKHKATLAHAISEFMSGVVLQDIGPPVTATELAEANALSKRLNEHTAAARLPETSPPCYPASSVWAWLQAKWRAYKAREQAPVTLSLPAMGFAMA